MYIIKPLTNIWPQLGSVFLLCWCFFSLQESMPSILFLSETIVSSILHESHHENFQAWFTDLNVPTMIPPAVLFFCCRGRDNNFFQLKRGQIIVLYQIFRSYNFFYLDVPPVPWSTPSTSAAAWSQGGPRTASPLYGVPCLAVDFPVVHFFEIPWVDLEKINFPQKYTFFNVGFFLNIPSFPYKPQR